MKKFLISGVVALAMVFSSQSAGAQTVAELQALINQLMAQIAAMQGGTTTTTTAMYTHSVTLRAGSTGPQVVSLQNCLNSLGFNTGAADGKFGPATANGARGFQASKGLTADGIVGPATGAQLALACTGTVIVPEPTDPGTQPGQGGLQGGAGDAYITPTSVDVEREVREGTTEKVLGFRVEAQDSDVQLTNLRVVLENTDAGAPNNTNRRPDRYISEIAVWMNDTKVGSVDATDLNRNGNEYSRNIALSNAIVREGSANRANFYVTFRALANIDSLDMATAEFDLDVDQIRFVDGSGAVMTSGTTLSVGTPGTGISFTDLAGSGEVRLRASLGNNNPAEQSIQVNEFSTTGDVTLLEFRLKAEGTDMYVEQIDVDLAATGASDLDEILGDLKLMRGNNTLADVATFAGAPTDTITFDLYDEMLIEEDDTETLRVVAKFLQQDGNFFDGDAIRASVDTAATIVEDRDGNLLPVGSLVGSASGNFQTLFVNGAQIEYVSSTSNPTNQDNTSRDFTLVFDVEAVGNDIVVDRTAFDATGVQYAVTAPAGAATPGDYTVSASLTSNAQLSGSDYTVYAGQTRRFTLTVNVATVTGQNGQGQYLIGLTAVTGIAPASTIETGFATVNSL